MKNYNGITGKNSKYISLIFFGLGLIGGIGFRIVLILNKIDPIYANISWYVASISYLFFYGYRLHIEGRRRKIITENELSEKILNNNLTQDEKQKIKIILDSILVSKFNWNLIILLVLTIFSIIIQVVVDIIW